MSVSESPRNSVVKRPLSRGATSASDDENEGKATPRFNSSGRLATPSIRTVSQLFRGNLPVYFNPARLSHIGVVRSAGTPGSPQHATHQIEMVDVSSDATESISDDALQSVHLGDSATIPGKESLLFPPHATAPRTSADDFKESYAYLSSLIPIDPPPRKSSTPRKLTKKDWHHHDCGHFSATIDIPLPPSDKPLPNPPKGVGFWAIMLTLALSSFLSALDLTSVSTALSTIAADFEASDSTWVGSSYALTSTACIPLTGSFAHIFGRRPTTVGCLLFFLAGSIVSGSAQTMNALIIGRSLQGVGGGGILTMTEILVVDLVPLAERGLYFGVFGIVWAIASGIGPVAGGGLASAGAWRWLFYINIPLSAAVACLALIFMRVKTPRTTWAQKLEQLDYFNFIFVAAATSTILGLTWGGVQYPWSSLQVILPLALGLVGMAVFLWLEKDYAKHPTLPFNFFRHRTALVGYICTFLHGILVIAVVFFIPVYFQACLGASPVKSGIDAFSLSFTVAPMAIIAGISVTITQHYKWQNLVGWSVSIIGLGTMSTLASQSHKTEWVVFPVIFGLGAGALFTVPIFAVVSPVPPSQHPQAMCFHVLSRSFGNVVGITIGSTVLFNALRQELPSSYLTQVGSAAAAYESIQQVKLLAEPLRTEVRNAFATGMQHVWKVLLCIAGAGLLVSAFMENLSLSTETDLSRGLADEGHLTPKSQDE